MSAVSVLELDLYRKGLAQRELRRALHDALDVWLERLEEIMEQNPKRRSLEEWTADILIFWGHITDFQHPSEDGLLCLSAGRAPFSSPAPP